jgi:hypothetical protein
MNVCRMLIQSRTNPSGRIGGNQSGEEYEVGMDTMDRAGRGAVNDETVRQIDFEGQILCIVFYASVIYFQLYA